MTKDTWENRLSKEALYTEKHYHVGLDATIRGVERQRNLDLSKHKELFREAFEGMIGKEIGAPSEIKEGFAKQLEAVFSTISDTPEQELITFRGALVANLVLASKGRFSSRE